VGICGTLLQNHPSVQRHSETEYRDYCACLWPSHHIHRRHGCGTYPSVLLACVAAAVADAWQEMITTPHLLHGICRSQSLSKGLTTDSLQIMVCVKSANTAVVLVLRSRPEHVTSLPCKAVVLFCIHMHSSECMNVCCPRRQQQCTCLCLICSAASINSTVCLYTAVRLTRG
jgi:hypothetical protein